ncbi:MAG: hypothetical protein AAGH79_00325 [Bacteroidota bacterium]
MKLFRIPFFALLATLFVIGCAKEEPSAPEVFNAEVEEILSIIEETNETADLPVDLSRRQIAEALEGDVKSDCPAGECCLTAYAFSQVLIYNGCTSGCPASVDLNCDGIVSAADILIALANYGCDDVVPVIVTNSGSTNIPIYNQADGLLKNYSTINGDLWFTTGASVSTNWYVNGVLVSTNNSLQLQYPGAKGSSFDVAIPCRGYYEITMEVTVECQTYSFTDCYYIGLPGLPSCGNTDCN